MNIVFINGSPNKNGNTAALAAVLLKNQVYQVINLTDFIIVCLKEHFLDEDYISFFKEQIQINGCLM